MKNQSPQMASSGVDALIERLQQEGIATGQEKAEKIVADAQKRAEWIIDEANMEAKLLINNAKAEAQAIKAAGEEALKLAARDTFIHLRDFLLGRFRNEIMLMVKNRMAEKKFLDKLILALAGRVREKSGLEHHQQVLIELPKELFDDDDLRKDPEQLQEGALSRFVAEITAEMLRDGVTFKLSEQLDSGLSIKLKGEDITIDFSDAAVANLLLEHLQPRFRALLEGTVR